MPRQPERGPYGGEGRTRTGGRRRPCEVGGHDQAQAGQGQDTGADGARQARELAGQDPGPGSERGDHPRPADRGERTDGTEHREDRDHSDDVPTRGVRGAVSQVGDLGAGGDRDQSTDPPAPPEQVARATAEHGARRGHGRERGHDGRRQQADGAVRGGRQRQDRGGRQDGGGQIEGPRRGGRPERMNAPRDHPRSDDRERTERPPRVAGDREQARREPDRGGRQRAVRSTVATRDLDEGEEDRRRQRRAAAVRRTGDQHDRVHRPPAGQGDVEHARREADPLQLDCRQDPDPGERHRERRPALRRPGEQHEHGQHDGPRDGRRERGAGEAHPRAVARDGCGEHQGRRHRRGLGDGRYRHALPGRHGPAHTQGRHRGGVPQHGSDQESQAAARVGVHPRRVGRRGPQAEHGEQTDQGRAGLVRR